MRRIFAILFLLGMLAPIPAQTPGNGGIWRYQLIEGSAVMDECLLCGRPSIWIPLNGAFDLVGTSDPQVFRMQNVAFASDYTDKPEWRITGVGTVDRSNGPELTADIVIQRLDATESIHLTNAPPEGARIFPMLSLIGNESPATFVRQYRLRIYAAPIREMWFSTEESLNEHGAGDLLSNEGRVVKRNSELTEKLALIEPADVSLDAIDIGARGEIFFSTKVNQESFVNGAIGHGDIVTSGGRVYLQNSQLLAALGVEDSEAGLDALHIVSEDEVYFSISKEVTRTNGAKLRRGDILSNKGRIVRSEAALLLRYQNPLTNSVGVDALYLWPNGEIWFSVETNFNSAIGQIDAGDLISDQGYIAVRNVDLVARFKPQRLTSVGLDAISIISDAQVSSGAGEIVEFNVTDEGADLRWESTGRVFLVEKALAVEGPYLPLSEIIIERTYHDAAAGAAAFYRLRQW
jgi:hypothetical protein